MSNLYCRTDCQNRILVFLLLQIISCYFTQKSNRYGFQYNIKKVIKYKISCEKPTGFHNGLCLFEPLEHKLIWTPRKNMLLLFAWWNRNQFMTLYGVRLQNSHLRNLLSIKISVGMLKLTININYSLNCLVVNSCASAPVMKTSVSLNLTHSLVNICYLDSTEIRLLLFEVSIEWLIIVCSLINISKPTSIQCCN